MRRLSTPSRIVVIALIGFVLFFGATNWFRQVNLLSSMFDMGNMDQVLWHSIHGQWFQMASPVDGSGIINRTSIHADFLLLIYTPFYYLWHDPRVLLVLQIVFVATGAIPLYWFARKKLGDVGGAFMALVYLACPTLEYGMTFDVHAVVLAAPLLLWAWWAMSEKRWWIYGLAAGLALFGKEEVGLVVAAMGIYWLFQNGYRRAALASIVVGLGWSMLMVGWAIPHARQAPGHFALGYFSDFGDSYTSIIAGVVRHPLTTLRTIFTGQGFTFLRALFIPLAFLPFIGLPVLLVATTEFAINMLSSNHNQQTIFFQYTSVIVPFLMLSTVDGWARLNRWLETHHGRWTVDRVRTIATTLIVAFMVAGVWFWSPLPGAKHTHDALNAFRPTPYRADINKVQAMLKPTDRVATTNNLGPQFSRRDWIWGFPNNLERADAAVVLEGAHFDVQPIEQVNAAVEALAQDPAWTVVYHRDAFWYFRKVGS